MRSLDKIVPDQNQQTNDLGLSKRSEKENEGMKNLMIFQGLQSRIPNLPALSWLAMKNITRHKTSGCSSYPSVFDIEYRNKYWQMFSCQDSTFHLYGAYLDNRTQLHNGPLIRILSMRSSKRFV